MLRTPSLKMHLLLLLVMMMMLDFMAMTAAQPRCDPLTQYMKDGECCKMCGPGTRMSSSSPCLDPQCTECGDNEYQDNYTSEPKCQRQPYCDKNLYFEVVVHTSKKKQSTCMCQEGFHCSSKECITCLPHTTCKPGHGVRDKGNHYHDTVCHNCTDGTFSDHESSVGVCKKWTECMDGHDIQQKGTDVSDNICAEGTTRTRVIAVVCVFIVLGIVVAIILIYYLCKGKRGNAEGKVKACFKCLEEQNEPVLLKETKLLITQPSEEEARMSELQSSQEEAGGMTPEENEDEHSQELAAFTENGNCVTQENGKSTILSRQESQTQTFTD